MSSKEANKRKKNEVEDLDFKEEDNPDVVEQKKEEKVSSETKNQPAVIRKEEKEVMKEEKEMAKEADDRKENQDKVVEGIRRQLNVDPDSMDADPPPNEANKGNDSDILEANFKSKGHLMDVSWASGPGTSISVMKSTDEDHVFIDARIPELKVSFSTPLDFPAAKVNAFVRTMDRFNKLYKGPKRWEFFDLENTVLDPTVSGIDHDSLRSMFKYKENGRALKDVFANVPRPETVMARRLQNYPENRLPRQGKRWPMYWQPEVRQLVNGFQMVEESKLKDMDFVFRFRLWLSNHLSSMRKIVFDVPATAKKYNLYIPYIFKNEGEIRAADLYYNLLTQNPEVAKHQIAIARAIVSNKAMPLINLIENSNIITDAKKDANTSANSYSHVNDLVRNLSIPQGKEFIKNFLVACMCGNFVRLRLLDTYGTSPVWTSVFDCFCMKLLPRFMLDAPSQHVINCIIVQGVLHWVFSGHLDYNIANDLRNHHAPEQIINTYMTNAHLEDSVFRTDAQMQSVQDMLVMVVRMWGSDLDDVHGSRAVVSEPMTAEDLEFMPVRSLNGSRKNVRLFGERDDIHMHPLLNAINELFRRIDRNIVGQAKNRNLVQSFKTIFSRQSDRMNKSMQYLNEIVRKLSYLPGFFGYQSDDEPEPYYGYIKMNVTGRAAAAFSFLYTDSSVDMDFDIDEVYFYHDVRIMVSRLFSSMGIVCSEFGALPEPYKRTSIVEEQTKSLFEKLDMITPTAEVGSSSTGNELIELIKRVGTNPNNENFRFESIIGLPDGFRFNHKHPEHVARLVDYLRVSHSYHWRMYQIFDEVLTRYPFSFGLCPQALYLPVGPATDLAQVYIDNDRRRDYDSIGLIESLDGLDLDDETDTIDFHINYHTEEALENGWLRRPLLLNGYVPVKLVFVDIDGSAKDSYPGVIPNISYGMAPGFYTQPLLSNILAIRAEKTGKPTYKEIEVPIYRYKDDAYRELLEAQNGHNYIRWHPMINGEPINAADIVPLFRYGPSTQEDPVAAILEVVEIGHIFYYEDDFERFTSLHDIQDAR